MNDLILQQAPLPLLPAVPIAHSLGPVTDDWHAIDVWLSTVAANSRNGKTSTIETYRYHLAKLHWYCENVLGRTPSRWSAQDVDAFRKFLTNVPFQFLPVEKGVPNHTPFRAQPSPSSQSDIMRFTKSMFAAFQKTG